MTEQLHIAQMAAQPLAGDGSTAPEWVHLLPSAGLPVRTRDGRGPYRIADPAAVVSASLAEIDTMVLDENHSTDIAAPQGQSAPARGWFRDIQLRADGIWGLLDWTKEGRGLVEGRAYRHISPVIGHAPDGTIRRILRASLVNRPNLRGLTALNHEEDMSLNERLAEVLGLNAAASEADILAAVSGLKTEGGKEAATLHSQVAEIGTALGVGSADPAAILAAARKIGAGDEPAVIALQAELADVTIALNSMKEAQARDRATGFIDGEIRKGRVGVKPLRDHYITRHMADANSVEKEIGALPVLGANAGAVRPVEEATTAHAEVDARDLAAKATAYQTKTSAEGRTISYAQAVRAVQGGAQ